MPGIWVLVFGHFSFLFAPNFAPVMTNLNAPASSRAVANWLLIGVFMLLVQVILGGITRLTGSGLSITEWNLVTGTLPPLNHAQWLQEFRNYQSTPQFRLLNADFSLSDFKFIFFWEWFHRIWARSIGFVFLTGFVYLVYTKKMKQDMIRPLIILFLLGVLQGAVGWIMVASGLTGDAVYVKPAKLAVHFVLALFLIATTFWFALQILVPAKERVQHIPLRRITILLLSVVFFQLIYGALMAGHKAAATAPTRPTVNGDMLPASAFTQKPLLLDLVENKITIHFIHRTLALLLFGFTAWLTICQLFFNSTGNYLRKAAWLPFSLLLLQILLGISAVFTSSSILAGHWGSFEWIAELHQVVGMLFMLSLVYLLFLLSGSKGRS
jgi:cytochrome c oxidase assembly protein subunit 15